MNSLHLKALLLAAEAGSISAAARKLGKKQPQVSQWISDLEIDLGVNFFDRTGNKTTLSKEGERLLPYLTHTMIQLDKFVQSAEMIAHGESTVVTIGIENYIPDLVFTQPLALTLDLPHLSVEVYREEKHQLTQDLNEGNVDIIIIHESDTLHHQHFEYCRLGHYKEVLVCSPNHPLATLPLVTTSDLSQYRELIWGETNSNSNSSKQHKDDNSDGFSPNYGIFSDIQPLVAMLKRNKGFAFLPAECVNTYIENDQLSALNCDFEPAGIDRRIELCWRNGLTLSQDGSQIVEAFKINHQLADKPVS
ncbi:LysR family transcriptional regulator [Photobacterium chitinilyticum]|uniref:LysR family transcriptional regulator n=1 Tax=Photobacterium chitinilyticum TaxID=2485123 RepID=A0A444JSX7_9GAMM|nr:LysR family transcriptional regulator [Photobacterium chitinilyticum]RWX56163.1 LysR family transcriptional regulator [Photobacterium chitinilyticum]